MIKGFIDLPGRKRYHSYGCFKNMAAALEWARNMREVYKNAINIGISAIGRDTPLDMIAA